MGTDNDDLIFIFTLAGKITKDISCTYLFFLYVNRNADFSWKSHPHPLPPLGGEGNLLSLRERIKPALREVEGVRVGILVGILFNHNTRDIRCNWQRKIPLLCNFHPKKLPHNFSTCLLPSQTKFWRY